MISASSSASTTSSVFNYSAIATGTTDLGWIQTVGLPTLTSKLLQPNPDVITATATGPLGAQATTNVTFNGTLGQIINGSFDGNYSTQALSELWDEFVRASFSCLLLKISYFEWGGKVLIHKQ